MHDRAVTVPLNMRIEALQGMCPRDIAHLLASASPTTKAMKTLNESACHIIRDEVHKSIAKVCIGVEVNRQVQKDIVTSEALRIKQRRKLIDTPRVRQISHHHRCADIGANCQRMSRELRALVEDRAEAEDDWLIASTIR